MSKRTEKMAWKVRQNYKAGDLSRELATKYLKALGYVDTQIAATLADDTGPG